MIKSIIRVAALCLVLALTAGFLVGCNSTQRDVRNLLNRFEEASNSLDIDEMLNCINPTIAEPVRLGLGLIGLFTPTAVDEILDQLVSSLTGDSGIDGSDFFSSIEIELLEVNTDGGNVSANTTVRFNVAGQNFEHNAVFRFVERSNQLYISGFRFG